MPTLPPVARKPSAIDNSILGTDRGDRLEGTERRDFIEARGGNDRVDGGPGDDQVVGGRGNDNISGAEGIDTAYYSGSARDYAFSRSLEAVTIRDTVDRPDGNDGIDVVRGVEQLVFKDRTVYLDGTNNAPDAQNDRGFEIPENAALRIPVTALLANDRDFDGDRLRISSVVKQGQRRPGQTRGPSVSLERTAVVYRPNTEGSPWNPG
jgi:Ca2+-binding RTX toxin-like protein